MVRYFWFSEEQSDVEEDEEMSIELQSWSSSSSLDTAREVPTKLKTGRA